MPQAIAAYLVTLGVSALVASIAAIAITIGISLGVSELFGRKSAKPSDGQQNVAEAIGSRRRHYGIVHTGGQRTFLDSVNGTLGINVTLGTGEEGTILEHRLNDRPVTVAGGTVTEASYHGAIHIYTRNGSASQSAIGELTAKFPAWTAEHRQRGCAHAAIICDPVKQEHFSEVFNGQMPVYSQVREGVRVYDPRLDSTAVIYDDGAGFTVNGTGPQRVNDPSTWGWDDNAALVIADYFAHPDGYGGGYDAVNWTNIAQEAEFSADAVETVTGEIIARWRIWASYSLASVERRQVLKDLLKACDGYNWQDAQGRFNLMVGRFVEPSIVLTDDHILGMTATLGPPSKQRLNALKVLYTEAAAGYREQESATIFDPDAVESPNTDPDALEAYYAPHHNQAARIGKLTFARLGDRWHISASLNLYGLNLLGERFARLESAQLGVAGYFMVSKLRLNLADQTVEAGLDEVRPEDWAFVAATEEGTPPLSPVASGPVPGLAGPDDLTLEAVQLAFGGANGVAIGASWGDPGRADLTWEAQYSPVGEDAWVSIAVDQAARTARSGPVNSATEFKVRVRAVTILGRVSTWTYETITPIAAAPTIAPPSIESVEGSAGKAVVKLRLPTTASFAFARLYHAAVDDQGVMTQVGGDVVGGLGQIIEITHTRAAGTAFYWVRAFDTSANPSVLVGPASATII